MSDLSIYLEQPFPKSLAINTGARHTFVSFDNLIAWWNNERQFLANINHHSYGGNYNAEGNFEIEIRQFVNQNRNYAWSDDEFLSHLKLKIEDYHRQQGFIDSKSREGIWLLKLAGKNPQLLPSAVGYFIKKRKGEADPNLLGSIHAYLFDFELEPNFEVEKAKYEAYFDELDKRKNELLDAQQANNTSHIELINRLETIEADWQVKFNDLKRAAEKQHAEQLEAHAAAMKKSEDFYEKKLAFKQAVTYWTDKAATHKKLSVVFGCIAGLLIVAALASVIFAGFTILNIDATTDQGKRLITEQGALQLWVYGLFIVFVTLSVWLIRLIVKVFLSNLHLQTDANERATMIQTYLALEREENVLKPEDKELILPSIFRSTSTGIVKDDGSPNTPLNVIMKNVGN